MGFKINVDRFGFAKAPKPEKNSRDYAAELAKSLIDKESKIRNERDIELHNEIVAEGKAREADKAELRLEVDDKVTGEVVARNDAISAAIAEEVTARNNAITLEENARNAKDAELEEAIRAEKNAREALSGEVSDKVSKKGGYGLSKITGGFAHNTLLVEVINEDGTTDNADVQLPGTTLAEYGITNAYTKSEVDAKIAAGGSGDLSEYAKKEEVFEDIEVWSRIRQDVDEWQDGYYWTIPSANASYKHTNIRVKAGDIVVFENVIRGRATMYFISAYDGEEWVESASIKSVKSYTVPENIDNLYITVQATQINNHKLFITRTESKQIIKGTKGHNEYVYRNGVWQSEADNLSANTDLVVCENVDNKKNHTYDVYAEFTEFDSITIAHGKQDFQAAYMVIDNTTAKTYHCSSSTSTVLMDTFEHGLSISGYIYVHIDLEHSNRGKLTISTNDGEYSVDNVFFGGCRHEVSVSGTQDMQNVKASYFVRDVYTDTWIFGDSYTAIKDTTKYPEHLFRKGYKNFLISGFGGAGAVNGVDSLANLLRMCSPRRVIWGMGMNDGDTSDTVNAKWFDILNEVELLCNNSNVELILATIPNVPTIRHDYKNQIVRESGYRYIDFAKAVNAESVGATWYEGMLSNDGVHPTEQGAKALAGRILLDVPEIAIT